MQRLRLSSLAFVAFVLAAIPVSAQEPKPLQPGTPPASEIGKEQVKDEDFPLATESEADPSTVPLDFVGKSRYYLKALTGPEALVRVAVMSGISIPGDKDLNYAQCLGSRYAEYALRRTINYSIGALRGEDPRFRRSGEIGFWPRTKFVMSRTVVVDMDEGGTSVAAGRLAGAFGANMIAENWQRIDPAPLRNGFIGGAVSLGGDLGMRMLREFWPEIKRKFK